MLINIHHIKYIIVDIVYLCTFIYTFIGKKVIKEII